MHAIYYMLAIMLAFCSVTSGNDNQSSLGDYNYSLFYPTDHRTFTVTTMERLDEDYVLFHTIGYEYIIEDALVELPPNGFFNGIEIVYHYPFLFFDCEKRIANNGFRINILYKLSFSRIIPYSIWYDFSGALIQTNVPGNMNDVNLDDSSIVFVPNTDPPNGR